MDLLCSRVARFRNESGGSLNAVNGITPFLLSPIPPSQACCTSDVLRSNAKLRVRTDLAHTARIVSIHEATMSIATRNAGAHSYCTYKKWLFDE